VIVKIDELSEEITRLLEVGGMEITEAANEAFKETADEGAKLLKKGGSYNERTGKYTPDWGVTTRTTSRTAITGTESYSVHNKKHYQLTHLLEKGHASRNGGRVRPYPHIEPVQSEMERMVLDKLSKKIGG
jgi:hypothetical protein